MSSPLAVSEGGNGAFVWKKLGWMSPEEWEKEQPLDTGRGTFYRPRMMFSEGRVHLLGNEWRLGTAILERSWFTRLGAQFALRLGSSGGTSS